MIYELTATTTREIEETFTVVVDADDPEEALDIAYHAVTEYPDTSITVKKLLRTHVHSNEPDDVDLKFKREPIGENLDD